MGWGTSDIYGATKEIPMMMKNVVPSSGRAGGRLLTIMKLKRRRRGETKETKGASRAQCSKGGMKKSGPTQIHSHSGNNVVNWYWSIRQVGRIYLVLTPATEGPVSLYTSLRVRPSLRKTWDPSTAGAGVCWVEPMSNMSRPRGRRISHPCHCTCHTSDSVG